MTNFILNHSDIQTELPQGTLLLDFIRYHKGMMGTKIGCREGDCGACTVLIGELKDGKVEYTSATSCLMALGNAHGKHIVTIEGINGEGLTPVQEAFSEEGATQCGFCTPGFIVSLTGHCLNEKEGGNKNAIDSMNGNICRCTGYKSIERAAERISNSLLERAGDPVAFAIEKNIIPSYFESIPSRLLKLSSAVNGIPSKRGSKFLGGGTDLYVQQHDTMAEEDISFLFDNPLMKQITTDGSTCYLGGSVTVTGIAESPFFRTYFNNLDKYIRLVSSTQIRNMATIAGNFTNASPIGDFTIFFLALDAQLILSNGENKRQVPLREFYKGYKVMDKKPDEFIEQISFRHTDDALFNFEKVCKRTWLDIASVNTAIHLRLQDDIIIEAGISAGGVGPVPAFLKKSSGYLLNKRISATMVQEVINIALSEISPISDARGSETYKRLLLAQLIKAHFISLFPKMPLEKLIAA